MIHLSKLIGSAFLSTVACFIAFTPQRAVAITYPYTIPGPVTASLDVNTQIKSPINSMQLSVNYGPYPYTGFNDATAKAQFRTFNPPSMRWPAGVWSNFYNWETDGRRLNRVEDPTNTYNSTYYGAVINHPNLKYGINGLTELHDELNFDILHTWNVCFDKPAQGIERLIDRQGKGFDFKWIELGNENFYEDQRSEAVSTPAKYVTVAKAHAQALKAVDPFIQTSVPAPWRTGSIPTAFNAALTADSSYYDAISVHKYLGGELLDASKTMSETVETMRGLFPGKPVWLTEWSVQSNDEDNAIGVMGMADVYLYFFNNMDRIAMNQYFQVNGKEEFFLTDNTKTSYGACYQIIRSVFENSEMFESAETSTQITTGINAVYSEAVIKDGKTMIFALNKADTSAPFTLKFDGVTYTAGMKHQTLAFSSASDFKFFGFTEDPLTTVSSNTTSITLPPLSLSVITLLANNPSIASEITIEAESAATQTDFPPYEVKSELGGPTYITLVNGTATTNYDSVLESRLGIATYDFDLLQAGDVTLDVMGRFDNSGGDSFWFKIDAGAWIKKDGLVGGSWKWVNLAAGQTLGLGSHTLKIARREAITKLDQFRLRSSTGVLADPLRSSIPPGGTTRIEAENYAQGGEGKAFHDTSIGNSGGVYRSDNVDIQACSDTGGGYQITGIQPGEWLQYPIQVENAGAFALKLRVARSLTGSASLRVLVDGEYKTGPMTVPATGGSWIDISKVVDLPAGKHVMQVKFTTPGIDLNHIELTSLDLPAPWQQADVGAVTAAGSATYSTGTFSVSGSGNDISGTADQFHYVYDQAAGDCEIVTRVTGVNNTHSWAKAGVMIRESLNENSTNASVFVTPAQGVSFQRRNSTGGTSASTTLAGSAPYWVKIKRVGNTFTGSRSVNGITWETLGSTTIAMSANVWIGLAVTSHNNGTLCAATFDNVSTVLPTAPPTADAGPDQNIIDTDTNGIESVTLTGTLSSTPQGTITNYVWTEAGIQIATGANPGVSLSLGTHTITLTVTNSSGATHSDTVIIRVAGPIFGEIDDASPISSNQMGSTKMDLTFFVGRAGASSGYNRSPVFVFKLPDLGAVSDPFTTASFSCHLSNLNNSIPTANVDLYGLPRRPIANVVIADYFGDAALDTTPGVTRLQDDFIPFSPLPATPSLAATNAIGSSALANYLNAQYASGAGANQYVFLRLSNDATMANNVRYTFTSADGAAAANGGLGDITLWPRISYTFGPPAFDGDGDGMPDQWEMDNFQTHAKTAEGDEDGDGVTNLAEYIAGTHPKNGSSRFAVSSMAETAPGSGQFTLTWPGVLGRTYTVVKSSALDAATWPEISPALEGTGADLSFTDVAVPGTSGFYKIKVSVTPTP